MNVHLLSIFWNKGLNSKCYAERYREKIGDYCLLLPMQNNKRVNEENSWKYVSENTFTMCIVEYKLTYY